LGTARTALFNWLFARQRKGVFVFRSEDTDWQRSKRRYEREIMDGLRWLGIEWDEGPDCGGNFGPYRQSERTEIYRSAVRRLLEENKAYEQEGAIYLRVGQQDIVVHDLVRGEVKFPGAEQKDFVIARSIDDPVYHLAVVVDDAAMQITHVIRGEDHLSNTPRHILLQQALGLDTPQYAHLPLLLTPARRKLSKRTGTDMMRQLREEGYLPAAILNFLALLGWNPKDEREIFSPAELIAAFRLQQVNPAAATVNLTKLRWLNRKHLQRLTSEELVRLILPRLEQAGLVSLTQNKLLLPQRQNLPLSRKQLAAMVRSEQERVETLAQLTHALKFYFVLPTPSPRLLCWKKQTATEARQRLRELLRLLEKANRSAWTNPLRPASLEKIVRDYIAQQGKSRVGEYLWPLRVALSGQSASPGPFEIMAALGQAETILRIKRAIDILK
jgi:glutamyl-tRNA synthetase